MIRNGCTVLLCSFVVLASGQKSSHVPYVPAGYQDVDAARPYVEPDAKTALGWWVPQRGVWTPFGWKDHLFRFTMTYDGALICPPAGILAKPTGREKYRGQDFQLTFYPSGDGNPPPLPKERTRLYKLDNGLGVQGWEEDHDAPVMYNKWPMPAGVVMKTRAFAHMQGGGDVTTATEPLYAWVRLSVDYVNPITQNPATHPDDYSFAVLLSRAWYIQSGSNTPDEIAYLEAVPELATLNNEEFTSDTLLSIGGGKAGWELREKGKVRLRVFPGGDGEVSVQPFDNGRNAVLRVKFPAKAGASVDMLVAMLPADGEVFDQEAALGFDKALAETDAYWAKKPETAATIHTPEKYINEALRRNIQFAEIIAELNPENGEYSFLSGAYGYDALWSTPTSMVSHMFLDLLGYHDVVKRHITLYKKNQGSVKPPGDAYQLDPGYFSTPKTLTSIDWLGDHGAIMEIISRHALLTGDKAFVDYWIEPLLKASDFIARATAATNHTGVKGVMPPAVSTDSGVPVQGIWTQMWCYRGLETTVRLLEKIQHPRAAEFAKVASNFKSSFQKAFADRTASAPRWTAPDGRQYPVLPDFLQDPPQRHSYDEAFLLDTGPMCLPWGGLADAHDPNMKAFADYFRVGPPARLWGPRSNSIAPAILMHEISSCESCYSWNIVNSWITGDRPHFIEGMYALFTGAISPQTYINCEHRKTCTARCLWRRL